MIDRDFALRARTEARFEQRHEHADALPAITSSMAVSAAMAHTPSPIAVGLGYYRGWTALASGGRRGFSRLAAPGFRRGFDCVDDPAVACATSNW